MTFPAEVVQAGRTYLERDAAALSIEQIVDRVQTAADRLRGAAEAVADWRAVASPDGSWSASDVLSHVVGWNVVNAQQILFVALSGELPAEAAPVAIGDRSEALAHNQEALDSLYAHVREADPEAFLFVRWEHPIFGELNWREWLLFLELHSVDHAKTLEAMAVG